MFVKVPPRFGDTTPDGSPTVGVTISPWVIGLIALVFVAPKLVHAWRSTSKREEK
jgi:hypothetical protein